MRRALLTLSAALLMASLAGIPAGRAATRDDPAPAADSFNPPIAGNYRWLMIEAGEMTHSPGGGQRVVQICQRAAKAGYNGLLLWDDNLWNRDLPSSYPETAEIIKKGLADLHFSLMLEMCPRGISLVRWSGDDSICEPRPSHPHPLTRNYRYLCLSHPGVIPIWEEQIKRAEEIYHPLGYLLQYDELRVCGDDQRCRESGKTPGKLLAEHAKQTIAMCRRVAPHTVIAVWNDMFDPCHNAQLVPYFHVKQGFDGAWEGIDKDVLIFNFNDKIESFSYWAKRGNRQLIPGYFDGELGIKTESELIRKARAYPNVIGWMYTSWESNYNQLEAYGGISGFGGTVAANALLTRPDARPSAQ